MIKKPESTSVKQLIDEVINIETGRARQIGNDNHMYPSIFTIICCSQLKFIPDETGWARPGQAYRLLQQEKWKEERVK